MSIFSSISEYVAKAKALIGLSGTIVSAAQDVEAAAGPAGAGQGAAKAAAVVGIVVAALDAVAPEILSAIGLEKVSAFVKAALDQVVNLMNILGIFKKPSPPSLPPAGT